VRLWDADIKALLKLADALIQRDPAIFLESELTRFGFDQGPSLQEQKLGDPRELTALRLQWLAPLQEAITRTQVITQ
jgi:hypothetical protein